jgi:tetratricopeptide (TPR) repeat protein
VFRLLLFAALCLALLSGPLAQTPSDPARARESLERGVALMNQGSPDAVGLLQQAAALDPENALAWHYLGTAQLETQSFREAQDSLQKALRLDEARPSLGRKLRRETADALGLAFAHQKDYAKATEVYRSALAGDEEAAGLWYNLACVRALSGDRAGALSSLREALQLDGRLTSPQLPAPSSDPDFKGLYGDPAFFAVLLTNVGPQPNDRPGDSLTREGARLLAGGNAAAAGQALRAALERDPESARAWFLLGGALEEMKDGPGAAAAYAKALSFKVPLGPDLVQSMARHAATRLGTQRLEEKAYPEALEAFKTASEADAFHPWPYYLSARAYAGLDQKEQALQAVQKAWGLKENLTPLDPPLPDALEDPAFAAWGHDPAWRAAVSAATR